MMHRFSVLMSVYIKEKPEFVEECFQSLLCQTAKASEWVVVEDGPLTQEMYALLDRYEKDNPGLIKRVPLRMNQGLGLALREGVSQCSNELIARMDTDDIAREDRFEKQLAEFCKNSDLDICGSSIDEFEDTLQKIVAKRSVPTSHNDIVKFQKRRDAFNHMTVMYKKASVLSSGNYLPCPMMEDSFLWVRMIQNGAKCMNIDDSLVFARIGHDMYKRRGGWSYFNKYRSGRKEILKTGFINYFDYIFTVFVQLCVANIPSRIRGVVYKNILHSNGKIVSIKQMKWLKKHSAQ